MWSFEADPFDGGYAFESGVSDADGELQRGGCGDERGADAECWVDADRAVKSEQEQTKRKIRGILNFSQDDSPKEAILF